MIGAITNIEALERWFKANEKPYFSVKYAGQGEKTIYRNDVIDNIEDAWTELRHQVQSQSDAGRAMLEVLAYEKGKNTHPVRTNVDIRATPYAYGQGAPGIGALPGLPGIGIADYINDRIEMERLKWENEELAAQINSPGNTWERIIDRIGANPNLAGIAQIIVAGFMQKMNPGAPGFQPAPAVNGTPATAAADGEEYDADGTLENVEAAAATLGVDPARLAQKLNELVTANPELAKTLLA